jgi:indole-3-glycerol phosphate synthase
MHSILKKIVAEKQREVKIYKKLFPLSYVIKKTGKLKTPRNFKKAVSKRRLSLIAEIKRASPSKGEIVKKFNPVEIAKDYQMAGVDAVSVLTERKYFKGDPEYLKIVKNSISAPVLWKDFIVDEYQIYLAKLYGADAILLICAILKPEILIKFIKTARKLKMYILVEVHSKSEVQTSLKSGADIIGINNRNLNSFEVDLKTTAKLIKYIPSSKIVVSESGIQTRKDLVFLRKLGVNAVLIGETLMRSKNIPAKIRQLLCLK